MAVLSQYRTYHASSTFSAGKDASVWDRTRALYCDNGMRDGHWGSYSLHNMTVQTNSDPSQM